MRVVRTVAALRVELAAARRDGRRIGLVPTMGAFHEGHLSLMRCAREECALVVVSLFVNPAQFTDPADLGEYPRDESRDERLARAAGMDLLFAPTVEEVYPQGFATTIDVGGLTEQLEGSARGRAHFGGVATVVTKLLNMVQPDVAYFGQKDAQQVLVIRQLARDLDFPVRIETCPTVREADGLAISSRNARLSPDARARAAGLCETLRCIEEAVEAGERSAAALLVRGLSRLAAWGIDAADIDYFSIVDADTLVPVDTVDRPTLVAVAARVGGVRLIDNTVVAAQ